MIFIPMKLPAHWEWIMLRTKVRPTAAAKGVVAIDKNGDVAAAVLFDDWTQTSGAIHIAIENPMVIRRGFLDACTYYFYRVCGKLQMIGTIPADNARSIQFAKRLGFEEQCRIPDGWDHKIDLVILTMREAQYRNAQTDLYSNAA